MEWLEGLGMTVDMVMVLGILFLTIFLFIANVVRVDVVAILILVILGMTKLLPPEQLFSGVSSDAVISLIAIMIISAGLENTGISLSVAKWMLKVGEERPNRILFLVMFVSGTLASFMRSLGTVALFLPIVTRLNVRTGISKSFLLLPMAFCAILGGLLTMVGSGPLIVLNSVLKNASQFASPGNEHLFEPFDLFYVFPLGGVLLVAGIIYLFIIRRKLSTEIKSSYQSGAAKDYFIKTYGKGGNIYELRLPASSEIVNFNLKELELLLPKQVAVIAIMQNGEYSFPPLRKTILKANCSLALMGTKEEIRTFAEEKGLISLSNLSAFKELLHPVRAGLCEAVIPPSSQLVSQEVRELHMRRNHKVHVLGLRRGDKRFNGDELQNLTLRPGDTLGMFSRWEALDDFSKHPDFFVLTNSYPNDKTYPKKRPLALFFFCLSIFLVVIGEFPISVGLLLGAAGMIATGVLTVDRAYDAVSWKTIVLLAGLIPLGLVVQATGTAEWLISYLDFRSWGLDAWGVLVLLAIATPMFALVLSNIGATVLLVPIAMDLALSLGADPRLYALTVAISASNTFMIPSHQVNTLIAGPGGYKVKDFIRYGGWMSLIFLVVTLLGIYLLYRN